MCEPEVYIIKMIVSVVATEIFSCNVLHLVGELITVESSLCEEYAESVCPVINEEECGSEMDSVVSYSRE